jgi:hypothetical protein
MKKSSIDLWYKFIGLLLCLAWDALLGYWFGRAFHSAAIGWLIFIVLDRLRHPSKE